MEWVIAGVVCGFIGYALGSRKRQGYLSDILDMKVRYFLPLILIFLITNLFSQQPILVENTISPDQKVSVAVIKTKNFDKIFYLLDLQTNKRLATIASTADGRSYSFGVASWNADSSKVALLIYYHKLSYVTVFAKKNKNSFRKIHFIPPDPERFYPSLKNNNASGASANALGPWLNNHRVSLISGDEKFLDQTNTSFLVSYEVSIKGFTAKILKPKAIGELSGQKADEFIKKWGDGYW